MSLARRKRLAHNDRAKEGAPVLQASVKLVTGSELGAISDKIRAKYGFMTKITPVFNTIGGIFKGKRIPYGDRGVVVTLIRALPPQPSPQPVSAPPQCSGRSWDGRGRSISTGPALPPGANRRTS
jgi:hypothetical protein